ncbi:MAG: metallophosphoesterase family protein [Erysipelotrichaceae bacterium]
MKILLMSDSHGKSGVVSSLLDEYSSYDYKIHCGDVEDDNVKFNDVVIVRGNNDYANYPNSECLEICGYRILVIHSHQFYGYLPIGRIAAYAKENGYDVVFYGHTHVSNDETIEGIRLINPGSLWRSRDGKAPSYALVEIETNNIKVEFKFL